MIRVSECARYSESPEIASAEKRTEDKPAPLRRQVQCVSGELAEHRSITTGNAAELGHPERTCDVRHRVGDRVRKQQIIAEPVEEPIPEVLGRRRIEHLHEGLSNTAFRRTRRSAQLTHRGLEGHC